MENTARDTARTSRREPWNKGKIVGQKAPLKLKDIWALRVRLRMENRVRELALFNLGIDSKLRGCDLVKLRSTVGYVHLQRPTGAGRACPSTTTTASSERRSADAERARIVPMWQRACPPRVGHTRLLHDSASDKFVGVRSTC